MPDEITVKTKSESEPTAGTTPETQTVSFTRTHLTNLCAAGLGVSFFLPWASFFGGTISGFDLQKDGGGQLLLYLQKQISGDGFRELYAPAEERKNQLEAELPKLEAEVDFLKVNKLSADDVVHESVTLHERWPSMQPDDKRKVVESLIEKIVIGESDIDITYSHAPSSEELCKSQRELGNR